MGMGRASRYDKSTHTGIHFSGSSGRTGGMDLKSIRLPGDHWSLRRDVMAWLLRGVLSPCTPYFSIQHSVFRRGRVDDWTMTSSFVIDTFFGSGIVSKSSVIQFYTGISYWLWEAVLTGQKQNRSAEAI